MDTLRDGQGLLAAASAVGANSDGSVTWMHRSCCQLLCRNVALGNSSAVTVPFNSSQLNIVGLLLVFRLVIRIDEYVLAKGCDNGR
jgi:hypothetical protein